MRNFLRYTLKAEIQIYLQEQIGEAKLMPHCNIIMRRKYCPAVVQYLYRRSSLTRT
jgi:hypothetical protein